MRKFMLGGLLAAVCMTTAFASVFPYVDPLTQRYYTNSTTLASYDLVEVPAVNGGMQSSENVAVITMTNAVVTALDEDGWTESTNKLTDIQAAFTLKSVSDDSEQCVWMGYTMGYTGGEWKEFTGADATSGTYTVKIEIDYTLTPPKVRYSVDDYVMTLKNASDSWVALGKSASVVEKVQLCGYGTTGAVEGKAGTRAAEGTFDVVEDVSANYESIRLGVVASTERWGVDGVTVKVKNSAGQEVGTVTQSFTDGEHGTNFVDLAQYVHPGETYTYDVSLTDSKSSRTTTPVSSDPVDLFSSDVWFAFVSAENAFTNATATGIVIADHKFSAADEEVEGTITPTEPKTNVGTVVETTIDVSNVCTDLQNYETDKPQFAVALGGTSDARVWKYCADGVWTNSATVGLPTTNGTYVGRATFDYASHKVKYEIRAKDSSEYLLLVEAATLPTTDTRLNRVGLLGGGTISALEAKLKLVEPAPIVPDEVNKEIALDKNGEVDLKNLTAGNDTYTVTSAAGKNCHLKWMDDKTGDGKYAVMSGNKLTVKSGTPANGLASYDSYVLGLNAEESTSKPAAVVVPGQDQSNGVVVNVPNLTGNRAVELGHTIKLRVMESSDGAQWTKVGADHDVNENVTVPLFDNSGKRYRVDTIIK